MMVKVDFSVKMKFVSGKKVLLYTREKTLSLYHTIEDHEEAVTAILISPDDSLLVTTDLTKSYFKKPDDTTKILVHDLNTKQVKFTLSDDADITMNSFITRKNLLVSNKKGVVVVYNLKDGTVRHKVEVNNTYTIEGLHLHTSHDFVLTDFRSTGVLNGITNKYGVIVNVHKGTLVSKLLVFYGSL